MIPIRDDAPRSTTPYVNYFLIALNVAVFLFEVSLGPSVRAGFVYSFGLVPSHVGQWLSGSYPTDAALVPFLSSMFLQASWFVVQFLSGAATAITSVHQTTGGIAFWAHVGGFVTGLILIKLMPAR